MPVRIDWEASGVYRTYFGRVTDSDRRVSLESICADRRFDGLRYAITDFSAISEFVESPQETLVLAALNVAPLMTNQRLVLAAVATDPSHIDYIERVKGHGFIDVPYEHFPDLATARRWIAAQTGIAVEDQRPLAPPA